MHYLRLRFHRAILVGSGWHLLPFGFLISYADRYGIWFPWKGDEVCWTWPWKRKGMPKYISLMFSGNGEFGDARFPTLASLDKAWNEFAEARKPHANDNP